MATSPFSNQSLINWLSTKNPDEKYDYGDRRCCMNAQFFRDVLGAQRVLVTSTDVHWRDAMGKWQYRLLPEGWDSIGRGSGGEPYTFGAALERALAMEMV